METLRPEINDSNLVSIERRIENDETPLDAWKASVLDIEQQLKLDLASIQLRASMNEKLIAKKYQRGQLVLTYIDERMHDLAALSENNRPFSQRIHLERPNQSLADITITQE